MLLAFPCRCCYSFPMSVFVMIAVLFAALLHASWNFFVKSNADKHLSMSAVVLGHMPFALAALTVAPMPAIESLPFILGGALLHTGYQIFLLAAYRAGDLSQVYPLARGAAPLIVAGISAAFLGTALSGVEVLAVSTIGIGIMSLSLVRQNDGLYNGRAAGFALTTGCFIASYSLVDGMGARAAGTALGFYGCLSLLNGGIFACIMRFVRPGTLTAVMGRGLKITLLAGGASFAAYAIVTWAFTQAPIPLVTALRETSIIFALLLGVFVLKERVDLAKVIATATTLFGVSLMRFKG